MARWPINFDYRLNVWDQEIYECLIQIEAHKQMASRIPLPPDFAEKINKINIIRQIKGTTGIEGNPLSFQEIENILDKKMDTTHESDAYKEVENANDVQEFIRNSVVNPQSPPIITEELILKLHYLSTKNIPSNQNIPGQYRTQDVHAGDYVPPEPQAIPKLMGKFLEVINNPQLMKGTNSIIRAIVAHFYLISIHPFGDGNGRTSRALEAYILYHSRYNARGFYSLANYFYRNRDRYIQELQDARFKYNADLSNFVKFAMKGFVEEIAAIQNEIMGFVEKVMFLSYVDMLALHKKINKRAYALIRIFCDYNEPFYLQQFKERNHPIISGLYNNIKTDKTITRDLMSLRKLQLINIDQKGLILPNINIMKQFID